MRVRNLFACFMLAGVSFAAGMGPAWTNEIPDIVDLADKALNKHDPKAAFDLGEYAAINGPISFGGKLHISNASAEAWYALSVENGGDYSLSPLRTLAGSGNASASLLLGDLLVKGVPNILEKDASEATRNYERAAGAHNHIGELKYGAMLAAGEGTDKDLDRACEMYLRASEGALHDAYKATLACLSIMPPEYSTKTYLLFRKSANQNADAKIVFAMMNIDGMSFEKNPERGKQFLKEVFESPGPNISDATFAWAANLLAKQSAIEKDEAAAIRYTRFAIAYGDNTARSLLMRQRIELGQEPGWVGELIDKKSRTDEEDKTLKFWISVRTFALKPNKCGNTPQNSPLEVAFWAQCVEGDIQYVKTERKNLQIAIDKSGYQVPQDLVEEIDVIDRVARSRIAQNLSALGGFQK